MKAKKSPERFSIRFDSSIPDHKRVIEILSEKGRNIARYIAEAIIAYESKNSDSIENTVTEVVAKILNMNKTEQEISEQDDTLSSDFDFDEISEDLEGFKR